MYETVTNPEGRKFRVSPFAAAVLRKLDDETGTASARIAEALGQAHRFEDVSRALWSLKRLGLADYTKAEDGAFLWTLVTV